MNLMELQNRYSELCEFFAVALNKHKKRILHYLEEIQNLQLEVEQETSDTMSKERKERELRIIQTVERSSMEREKASAELSRLVEELEEIEYLLMRVASSQTH